MASCVADPATFLHHCTERSVLIRAIRIGEGVLAGVGDFIRSLTPASCSLVVGDANSYAAAGQQVAASLTQAGLRVETLVLPSDPPPRASVSQADRICQALQASPDALPIAVGSGVVNDLVKYAAFRADRHYVSVATAASMDGYVSTGAPLEQGGFKITIPTRPPIAMIADIAILASAPLTMNAWGYGDLAGKIPAGADWILADALGIEPIDAYAWSLVQNNLKGWLSDPVGVAAGKTAAIAQLFTGLMAVGFAMESHVTSRPASGADHQIAHIWEMEGLAPQGIKIAHGAAVAVGTVITLSLYDWLLKQDLTELDCESVLAASPDLATRQQHLASVIRIPAIAERARAELAAKHSDRKTLARRLDLIRDTWSTLRDRLARHLLSPTQMTTMLQSAGAPTHPEAIAVTATHLTRTLHAALYIRRRYTILDFLHETGLLPSAIRDVVPRIVRSKTEMSLS